MYWPSDTDSGNFNTPLTNRQVTQTKTKQINTGTKLCHKSKGPSGYLQNISPQS